MKKIWWLFPAMILMACEHKTQTLFRQVPATESGIQFVNTIEESDTFNILTQEYIYNGGGTAVGDFNNDGLQDIFFAGNLVPNRLYLNRGKLAFDDVSETAGIQVPGRWNSGVAVVDINGDGWQDIYVCATMHGDAARRKNMLFIHQGLDEEGRPTFADQAAQFGLADEGYSVTAAFFDYDRDGDLDVYVLTNERLLNVPTNFRPKITDGTSPNNDRLYRNNGNGTFSNVSREAGILIEGFGLGLAISDVNKDGWPDIYVSNDYLSNDLLYINNQDGTFTNRIGELLGHQSLFSMGNDAADVNNDAWSDIITLDMLPETNFRKKSTISNKSYLNYINNEKYHYEYQHVRNMLHLNNGANLKFSEIGQMAGMYQTEWSWSPLLADFDNDGYKDLIITNGFPKDVTDKDFSNYRADVGNVASPALLIDSIPVVKIPNYAFRNQGDLSFADVTQTWGLGQASFSNGAAFADLDNDGDLDYIVNNINEAAFLFENTLYNHDTPDTARHFLRVRLKGPASNPQGIGAQVTLYHNGTLQYGENNVYRGFLSSVEQVLHFGLPRHQTIDSLVVLWVDGHKQTLRAVQPAQTLEVLYSQATPAPALPPASSLGWFQSINAIAYRHDEDDKIDFNLQRTLPHKFSQAGPGLAVGDVNADGREDVLIGSSANLPMAVWLQDVHGAFREQVIVPAKPFEDEGVLLFDADNDHDLDIYAVSGSVESIENPSVYQDRLYINNGKGAFQLSADALPDLKSSGSCVRAADFDNDGDLDLFVGGRVIPGAYPEPPQSYILQNDKGAFRDITTQVAPALRHVGMVTDAVWSDVDQDGAPDLVVVGEFMPVMWFRNQQQHLEPISVTGIERYVGWYNSLAPGDFDRDGDIDFMVGNLGLNNSYQASEKYPLTLYAKDFDGNGSIDPVLGCYMKESLEQGEKKLYPVHFWDELNSQSPKFRRKFSRYRAYGKATLEEVLTLQEREGARILKANHLETAWIENDGKGKFTWHALPPMAQVGPVNGMVVTDVNDDGALDVVMVGNDYGNEVFIGRYDAFTGQVALNDGRGHFTMVGAAQSGFYVPGDGKALARLHTGATDLLVATQNRSDVQVFSQPVKGVVWVPERDDVALDITGSDGRHQRVELYWGCGYLSQSSRTVIIPASSKSVTIYKRNGQSRPWQVPTL